MKGEWSIRSQLFLLIAVMAVPLVAVIAYDVRDDFNHQREIASTAAITLADITATGTARFLQDTQTALASLSRRPLVRALDPRRCDPALRDYLDAHPNFANILTTNTSAQVVCSKVPI